MPQSEIHYLTKKPFKTLVANHPAVHTVHTLDEKSLSETLRALKSENFDYILDLHHNLRSYQTLITLKKPFSISPKLRFQLFLFLKMRLKNRYIPHVSLRHYQTAWKCVHYFRPELNPADFSPSLSFTIPDFVKTSSNLTHFPLDQAYSVVLGATYATKKWLPAYFVELINALGLPVILLGGNSEKEEASRIAHELTVPYYNATENHTLMQSAALMAQTRFVLTHDTGFMHIASALQMKILSLWGSTSPALGFGVFQNDRHFTLEIKELSCHPCAKIGLKECPKQHFACMKQLTPEIVIQKLKEIEFV